MNFDELESKKEYELARLQWDIEHADDHWVVTITVWQSGDPEGAVLVAKEFYFMDGLARIARSLRSTYEAVVEFQQAEQAKKEMS